MWYTELCSSFDHSYQCVSGYYYSDNTRNNNSQQWVIPQMLYYGCIVLLHVLFHVFILFANSLVIELLMEVIRVQRKKLICLLPISVKCNLVIIMKPNTSQVFSSRFTHTHISRHIAKIRDILLVHILYEGYG